MYLKYFWSILRRQFQDIRYFSERGQGGVLFKSKWDALKWLWRMLVRRNQNMKLQTIPDSAIEPLMIKD